MIKRIYQRKENSIRLELSWKDRHPINYDSGPSEEDLKWLEDKIEKDKQDLLNVR